MTEQLSDAEKDKLFLLNVSQRISQINEATAMVSAAHNASVGLTPNGMQLKYAKYDCKNRTE